MTAYAHRVPRAFILRRLHSLMGLMLTIFLVEHLITNSQAALWIGEDGLGFVRLVNAIHDFPFLQGIEWAFIGIPFIVHGYLGIKIALQGRFKSFPSDGSKPSLPQYARNQSYTWQRLTSWILLVGIIAHVVHMRFVRQPEGLHDGVRSSYIVKVETDPGLYMVADRLQVGLFSPAQIAQEQALLIQQQQSANVSQEVASVGGATLEGSPQIALHAEKQHLENFRAFVSVLTNLNLESDQVAAVADNFGTALLLVVRNSMKVWWLCLLYTLLVLSACFHAYNGLWTFMITWGTILNRRSQRFASHICMGLVGFFSLLGLAAVWGTYWFNLYT